MSDNELETGLAGCDPSPDKWPGLISRLFAPAENEFEILPKTAYDAPIRTEFGSFGWTTVVCENSAVGRVLVENSRNYPKHPKLSSIMKLVLGDGLFLSSGQKWRAHRKAILPSLTKRGTDSHYDIIVQNIIRNLETWKSTTKTQCVDIVQEMSALTFGITAECLFGADSDGMRKVIVESIALVEERLSFVSALDLLPCVGRRFLNRKMKKMHVVSAPFDHFIKTISEELSEHAFDKENALSRLIAVQPPRVSRADRVAALSDEIRTLLFAGSDTSVLVISFAIYVLTKRNDIESKFYSEIDQVCGERPPSLGDLPKLQYTRMLLNEVMRLFPPAPVLTYRQAKASDFLCGEFIPAGRTIMIMPWLIHRSRQNWDRPEEFDPERFWIGAGSPVKPYAFIPFGAGPRTCIGRNFAMLEMAMILVMLSQKYRFVLLPQPKLVLRHRITLRPRDGIKMKIIPR